MRKFFCWPLLALLALSLAAIFTACGEKAPLPPAATPTVALPTQTSAVFPLTVRDSRGQQITIQRAATRIVALAPSYVETLFAVGAGPAVVAVDQNTDFPSEAAALPKLSGFQPSVEAIAAVNPDLILMFYNPGGIVTNLEALGLTPLYRELPTTVEGVLEEIRLLGRITDHPQQAEAVAQGMQRRIDAVKAKVQGIQQGPRIYHEVDPTFYTAGPNSFIGGLYTILKTQNIAFDAPSPFPQLSQEVIIQRDPQVIVVGDRASGDAIARLKSRPGWAGLAAVRQGRVYGINPDIISRPGPRLVEGLEALAKLLYPELFP